MLHRVHAGVAQRGLVEHGQVPPVEVDQPQRECDQWMGEGAQAVEQADPEHGDEQRAGEPQHDQQCRDVAEQEVLDHVHEQQVLADAPE